MTVTTTKKKSKQKRSPKAWVLLDLPLDDAKLTEPEKLMAMRFKLRYPAIYSQLRRSNAPYMGQVISRISRSPLIIITIMEL